MAGKREVIHIPGMEHGAPIPNGAKLGNVVFSSAISGRDSETHELSADPDEQAAALFRNLERFLTAAGAKPEHVGHMTVYLKEERYRDSINKEWLKMFPDEHDRPARHAVKAEIRGDILFQVEIVAIL